MKKILCLFSSIMIGSSTAITAVACAPTIDKVEIVTKDAQQVINTTSAVARSIILSRTDAIKEFETDGKLNNKNQVIDKKYSLSNLITQHEHETIGIMGATNLELMDINYEEINKNININNSSTTILSGDTSTIDTIGLIASIINLLLGNDFSTSDALFFVELLPKLSPILTPLLRKDKNNEASEINPIDEWETIKSTDDTIKDIEPMVKGIMKILPSIINTDWLFL